MQEKSDRDKFWKLYKELPQELKDTLFAEETTDSIYEVCKRNKITDNHQQIIEYVGQVLIGVLKPSEFQETIEQELELEKDVAKKATQEINRFIFYPVKKSLEDIYNIEITPLAQMKIPVSTTEKKPAGPKRKDVYREPVQ